MKDRYLFRGKCIITNDWQAGHYAPQYEWWVGSFVMRPEHDEHHFIYYFGYEDKDRMYKDASEIDPATIGQCTGLKDKNGNLIFEGDIIKCESSAKYAFETFAIVWHENGFFMENKSSRFHLDTKMIASSETVGNIHDNPQLLEVGV